METARLILRQWREADFETFAAYFSNEETAKYVGGKKTREEAWRLMAAYIGHWHLKGFSYLAVQEKESNKIAGCIGLWKSDPWPELEMGYWFLKEMQGKGYATEAGLCMKNFAFETVKSNTLVSYIDPANIPSRKLSERLGGVHEQNIQLLNFGEHCVYRYAHD